MSSTWKRHSRGTVASDMDRVAFDEGSQLRAQRLMGHEVNRATQQIFERELKADSVRFMLERCRKTFAGASCPPGESSRRAVAKARLD